MGDWIDDYAVGIPFLEHLLDELYLLADGNTGEGCWELYDRFDSLLLRKRDAEKRNDHGIEGLGW